MNECMEIDKKVQILLSTYNGEKYLREQLESFIQQTIFSNITVLIRDDGSNDGTINILQEYEAKYNFLVEYGANIGTTRSYLWLLEHSNNDCEFFAFSDQDDVWLPDKLAKEVAAMKKMSDEYPRLVATQSEIVNERLQHQGFSISTAKGVSFFNAMVQNVCPGHTQLLDRKLRDIVCKTIHPEDILVVDWWVYLIAAGVGNVQILPEVTVRHRQHGNNAVGYRTSFLRRFIVRLRRLRSKTAAAMTKQLISFYSCYGQVIRKEYRMEIERFLGHLSSLKSRIQYVMSARFYRQSMIDTAGVKILYILGKYSETK